MNGKILRALEAEARAERKRPDMDPSEPAPVIAIAANRLSQAFAI